jgi:hypothetical protein
MARAFYFPCSSSSLIRGVQRSPLQEPLPAPVALRRSSTVVQPDRIFSRKTRRLIPLQMQTGFRPSIISRSRVDVSMIVILSYGRAPSLAGATVRVFPAAGLVAVVPVCADAGSFTVSCPLFTTRRIFGSSMNGS